jgi:hypothetical protein
MRFSRPRLMLMLVAFAVAAGAAVVAVPAHACMTTCVFIEYPDGSFEIICDSNAAQSGVAPRGQTTVTMLEHNKAIVRIGPYVTPKMDVAYDCSVAFSPVPGIVSVDNVSLVEDVTGRQLPFYSWSPSAAASTQFSDLTTNLASMSTAPSDWQGFFSEVPGSPGGIVHSFILEVTLEDGITAKQLTENLREFGVLANGSANPDGQLNYGHYHLRVLGNGPIHQINVRTAGRRSPAHRSEH